MADDVTVHNGASGTGTSFDVATDDDGSGNQVQLIKLVQSADGSRSAIGADANGLDVDVIRTPKGTKTAAAATCDTTADQLVAANSSRKSVTIRNVGTVDLYLGLSGVTTATGMLLAAGETIVDPDTTDAWYGITASGTASVRYIEVA